MTRLPACILALFLATLPAAAQDILGTTLIQNKRVDLLSDFTWRYADTTTLCTPDRVNAFITLCLPPSWESFSHPKEPGLVRTYFNEDLNAYVYVIHEDVGTNDAITPEFVRRAVLFNAATGAGVEEDAVVFLGVTDTTVAGHPAERLTYAVPIEGTPFTYHNTLVLLPDDTLQVLFTSLDADLDIEPPYQEVLTTIQLTP
ncbi:MAG: hypothetical protein OXE84_00170 [Rhodobacteraceae bacterium]|nr:hypothetical protein [Paracoccaceae bacterium]MCY4328382.1 hypothetical protein [Paracoccaceae bacterium]